MTDRAEYEAALRQLPDAHSLALRLRALADPKKFESETPWAIARPALERIRDETRRAVPDDLGDAAFEVESGDGVTAFLSPLVRKPGVFNRVLGLGLKSPPRAVII